MAFEQIQVRRDTAANWALADPVLGSGEPAYETDTGVLKVGNGTATYSALPTYVTLTINGALPANANAALQTLFDARYLQTAKSGAAQQQAGVTITPYLSPDLSYEYEVVVVHAPNNYMNSVLEKSYTADYEKTWTSGSTFAPVTQPFANFQTQTGAHVILSADAWQGSQMSGVQIKKNVLYRGWGNYSNDPRVGQETLALMNDGTWRTYAKTDYPDPTALVTQGVDTTWGFGPLVVVNGAVRSDLGDSAKWTDWVTSLSGRHLMGYNAAGEAVFITVKGTTGSTGIAGVEMGNVALRHGCVNAIMLDGGGSVQGRSSYLFHPSTDAGNNRDVANVTAIKASLIRPITVAEEAVPYASGFSATSGQLLTARKVNGETRLRGSAQMTNVAANTWYTAATLTDRFRPGWAADAWRGAIFNVSSGYAGMVSISPTDGTIQVKLPVAAAGVSYWQFDSVRFDAKY